MAILFSNIKVWSFYFGGKCKEAFSFIDNSISKVYWDWCKLSFSNVCYKWTVPCRWVFWPCGRSLRCCPWPRIRCSGWSSRRNRLLRPDARERRRSPAAAPPADDLPPASRDQTRWKAPPVVSSHQTLIQFNLGILLSPWGVPSFSCFPSLVKAHFTFTFKLAAIRRKAIVHF